VCSGDDPVYERHVAGRPVGDLLHTALHDPKYSPSRVALAGPRITRLAESNFVITTEGARFGGAAGRVPRTCAAPRRCASPVGVHREQRVDGRRVRGRRRRSRRARRHDAHRVHPCGRWPVKATQPPPHFRVPEPWPSGSTPRCDNRPRDPKKANARPSLLSHLGKLADSRRNPPRRVRTACRKVVRSLVTL
jgi:hypothetical protein